MTHLLAYLALRDRAGNWKVTSHRSLDSLTSDWKVAQEDEKDTTAVVHVGFWRPDFSLFDFVCSHYVGLVLLTGPAKESLPRSFLSSKRTCAVIDNFHVYLALSGWGYEADETIVNSQISGSYLITDGSSSSPNFRDWLLKIPHDSDLIAECARFSIHNDTQYFENEHLLSPDVRERLSLLRFQTLFGVSPSNANLLEGLKAAPPWILHLPIAALDLPLRAKNCFTAIKVTNVSDILNFGIEGLRKVKNLGNKTISDISEALYTAYTAGCIYCDNAAKQNNIRDFSADELHLKKESLIRLDRGQLGQTLTTAYASDPASFTAALDTALSLVNDRDATVLRQRMGINGKKMTLEEIAIVHKLTRERIRQIELRSINKIVSRMNVWNNHFKFGIANILKNRQDPLPLVGLPILDSWFTGIESKENPFEYALEKFINPTQFALIRVNGQTYVSALRQDEWNEAEKASRNLVESLLNQKDSPKESHLRLLVESHLVGKGEELRSLLWEMVIQKAHFSEETNGERVLVSYGMDAESVVEAVLFDSDTPLHYSEIAKRCALRGRIIDTRRCHNAAATVGYLLGRGVYGLQRHIELSKDEQVIVIEEVEVMLANTPGRQWHVEEIIEELGARGLDFDGRLSKYELNVILKSSTDLVDLGRFVWMIGRRAALRTSDRLNVWQAIVALIQRHGSPMHASEIRSEVTKDRGVNSFFQIHQADPLIRVGENQWGILWRDIPFNEDRANAIVDEIISVLKERNTGLHVSEIIPSLNLNRDIVQDVNPIMLAALACRREQVKSSMGGYVYLAEWNGPRRLSVSEAVEQAFDTFTAGVLAVEVAKKATTLLGRELASGVASSILMKIAFYDPDKKLWFHIDDREEDSEEASLL